MTVVPLDSARWSELQHAYAAAGDIPALLKRLVDATPSDAKNEPWHSLWSSLCHQGTVYTASYAAVPHIVEYARARVPKDRLDYLLLVASISVGRSRSDAAVMPVHLSASFNDALSKARHLAIECLDVEWPTSEYRNLLASIATLQSQQPLGQLLFAFDDTYECPNCEKRLTETLI